MKAKGNLFGAYFKGPAPWFSGTVTSLPRQNLAMPRDNFGCYARGRPAPLLPSGHRPETQPASHMRRAAPTKNYLAPHVNSAKDEKT